MLLVEDDADTAALTAAHFSQHGFEVLVTADGPAAIEIAATNDIALAVVDLMLPRTTGAELIEQLKVQPGMHNCPIVVSSILDRSLYPTDIFAALPKPVMRADVAHLVERLSTVG